jgi:hypothetical protein
MSALLRNPDGTITLTEPVVFSCGCANTTPEARNKLRMAGCGNVPIIMTTTSELARKFIKQLNLGLAIPSLNKNKHSVLYNPKTGQYIDLLKAPKSDYVYDNIFKVVSGR